LRVQQLPVRTLPGDEFVVRPGLGDLPQSITRTRVPGGRRGRRWVIPMTVRFSNHSSSRWKIPSATRPSTALVA